MATPHPRSAAGPSASALRSRWQNAPDGLRAISGRTIAPDRAVPVAAGTRVLVVAGGASGVGTSTTAGLLAAGVAAAPAVALLVDAAGGPQGLEWMMDREAPDVLGALEHGADAIRQVVPVSPNLGLLRVALHMAVPTGDGRDETAPIPASRRALIARVPTAYAGARAVVVDAGSRIDAVRTFVQAGAHGLIVVARPSHAASVAGAFALCRLVGALVPAMPRGVLLVGTTEQEAARVFAHLDAGSERFSGGVIEQVGWVTDDQELKRGMDADMTLREAALGSAAASHIAMLGRQYAGLISGGRGMLGVPERETSSTRDGRLDGWG